LRRVKYRSSLNLRYPTRLVDSELCPLIIKKNDVFIGFWESFQALYIRLTCNFRTSFRHVKIEAKFDLGKSDIFYIQVILSNYAKADLRSIYIGNMPCLSFKQINYKFDFDISVVCCFWVVSLPPISLIVIIFRFKPPCISGGSVASIRQQ
jgi:hypothetical protein